MFSPERLFTLFTFERVRSLNAKSRYEFNIFVADWVE